MAGKIYIVTSVYPPDVAGPGVYFASLKEAVARRGWIVAVLVRPSLGAVLRAVRSEDIVLAHGTPKILLTVFLAKVIRRFKFISRIGGDYFWERSVERGEYAGTLRSFYASHRLSAMRHMPLRWFMCFVFRRADALVFTGPLLYDIYVPLFGLDKKKVFVITHPLSELTVKNLTTYESRQLPAIRYKMLYAGRFLKLKNLEMFLEIFAEARKKHPNLVLTLIGDGPEKQRLAVSVGRLCLKNAVIFKESMRRDEVLEEIVAHHLVVLPSFSEVSPNLLMDAVTAGTPFLATQENGLREVLEGAGTWFNPMSKEDFAYKLETLLAPGALEEARERMRSHPYRKTWSEVAEEYERVFKFSAQPFN